MLIADDDPAIADALRFMLEDEGYGVVSAFAGDIVADVRRERPDVVLLDVRLAGQDGRELCRAIKRQEVTALTPVILVSADPDCAAIATEAGADDFLAKPFEMDDLFESGQVCQGVARWVMHGDCYPRVWSRQPPARVGSLPRS